jgi:hypothetical protein
MTDNGYPRIGDLHPVLERFLDRICDRFENAWLAGQRPRDAGAGAVGSALSQVAS